MDLPNIAQHGPELPRPSQEVSAAGGEAQPAAQEVRNAQPQGSADPNAQAFQVESSAAQVAALQNTPPPAQPIPQAAMPQAIQATDADLIEKEWIERAKKVIGSTREDPYLQNKEINKVKAEYIERRWNKKIKLADDPKQ